MASPDPYATLGVSRNASDAEIKRAFRKLARKHHPDRNPDDAAAEARFKEVQAAYEMIGDASKRGASDGEQQLFKWDIYGTTCMGHAASHNS